MTKKISILIFIVSIAAVTAAYYFQEQLSEFQSLGLLGIFLINVFSSATVFLPAPGFLSVIAGGSLYNPVFVALAASLGSAIGDMVGYAMGYSGRKIVNKKLSKKLWFKVTQELFKKYGSWALFFFSLVPNPFFDSIGIIAGVFHYSPLRFLAIVFVGRFLRFLLLAAAGAQF